MKRQRRHFIATEKSATAISNIGKPPSTNQISKGNANARAGRTRKPRQGEQKSAPRVSSSSGGTKQQRLEARSWVPCWGCCCWGCCCWGCCWDCRGGGLGEGW